MTDDALNEPIRLDYPNPLGDDSRWTFMGSRHSDEFWWDAYEELGAMIGELMAQRPPDDPARILWEVLPKAQRPQ